MAEYWRLCPELARLRFGFANAIHAAWDLIPGAEVTVLYGKDQGREFQRNRRVEAERRAKGEVYCVADDDCLPRFGAAPGRMLDDIAGLLRVHADFAILSAWPENCNIQRWRPEDYAPVFDDDDVSEHVSVGGIRFMRKGAQAEWPPQEGNWYDRTQADWLRAHGWRVGLLRNIKTLHLGEGYSTL